MPRGCDYSVHVRIQVVNPEKKARGRQPRAGLRHFIVEFDADGEVLRIKERKQMLPPQSGVYNHPWWKAGTHPLGVLPRQIIAAARAAKGAVDATP